MPMDLTFRFAGPADVERLTEFFESIPDETKRVYGPHFFDAPTAKARCNVGMDDEDLSIIAVDESGEVLGYCVYLRRFTETDVSRDGYHVRAYDADEIITVAPCVKQGVRARGLGRMLLEFAGYRARCEGRKALVLFGGVRCDNVRALRTYQSVGFRILGFWPHPNCPANYDMAWDVLRPEAKGAAVEKAKE